MVLAPWTCVCGQRNAGPSPCSRCLTTAPVWVQQEPVLPEAPARHRWLVPLVVVTAVLLILGVLGVLGVVLTSDDESTVRARDLPGAQTIRVSPDSAPSGLTGTAGEIAAAMPGLMTFVQDARGLAFKEPVDVTLLPDGAFRDRLLALQEEDERDREEIEDDARVLRALGLLEGEVDLAEAMDSLLGDAVAGFYDTDEDDLVVRGDRFSSYVKLTFVHELTHALQDQHFDLERDNLDESDDEAAQSFTAIVEGDAVRVEEQYLDTLSDAEQKAAQDEEMAAASGIDPTIPRILLELISFPYALGPRFTREVVAAGGQERLDAAFREPPITSEQILHPEKYLEDGEPPRAIDEPTADGEIIDEGVIGELGLILIFQRLLENDRALVAAQGWGADWYVAWRDGDDACVRANVVMDTAEDARQLREALRAAASEREGLKIDAQPGVIAFTACG